MKKILLVGLILSGIIAMNSCDYDDSNDLDVLTPNDSIQAQLGHSPKTIKKSASVGTQSAFHN
ncbi:hypothetical protein HZY62_02465 [Maribacter polysiphoniae]|uniref:Uncharacterized protein n=1 Tax=Maribacter polysiphoniae TaxID=429344 RepID=A0A316E3L4_9FLAO|nr:hypothetical protein [Maribacter polysiphoniae]MBD1259436.1 hypothetical protein [Maribacter polysiphoniae]PWK25001.1 hypothetical protein LX92_01370 [Maribacter polysiphoniae]